MARHGEKNRIRMLTRDFFPFGAQYYRAPTPGSADWERDIKTAKAHGLNIMRVWVMWRWYNRIEGEYDFAELHELHGIFKRNGMKLIFLLVPESAPAWLIKKHPEAMYLDQENRACYPEVVPNVCSGGFPGLCFHNDAVLAEELKFISKAAKEFGKSKTVFAWEPHNEPQIEPSRYKGGVFCYCPASIGKFRLWLKKRYKRIDALNRAWVAAYGSFDEIDPPRYKRGWND